MNLGTYLDTAAEKYNEKPYLQYYDDVISYGELAGRVNVLAGGLKSLGFKKGDFIHVLVQNRPEVLVAYFAIQKIGAVTGPINGWWKADEVEYLLNDSKGRGLIIEDQYLPILNDIRDRCPHLEKVIEIGKAPDKGHFSYDKIMAESPRAAVACGADPQDVAFIFYTSGTTGNPKGVLLTHRNVLADVDGISEALHLDENMTVLCFLPLFHVNAMLTCVSSMSKGHRIVLRKTFSAGEYWEVVDKYKVNFWSAVPAVYQILLSDPGRQKYDLSSLQFGVCGAAPLTKETMTRFQDTFNIPIVEGYGLTEATCVSTINPRGGVRKVGSIGLPLPGQTVKIVNENGGECPPGERGEILIGGDVVMKGYYNRPEETREAVDADGFLHTGDIAFRDEDGYIFIVDRIKDMIIRSGENIYPSEIDRLLASHPKVAEAATIGVPDEVTGEAVKSFVIASDDSLTVDELIAFCREKLADFKVPRYVELLEEDFPRNRIGKVLKKELKKWGITPRPKKEKAGGATAADIFGTMEGRVRPEGIKGVTANYGYKLSGEGGGEWTVCVNDTSVKVLEGIHDPNVTSTASAKDFIDITLGKLDGMAAFTSGRLKVEGDMSLMMKAPKFFKKYAPPSGRAGEEKEEELIRLKQVISVPQRFATGPLMGKFLQELKDNKRILANKCPKCGRLQSPPREICAICRVRADELVEIGPEGKIANYDIAYYASPDPLTGESRETPYCAAFMLLDGCTGSDIFWHEINPAHIDRVKKNARVRPVWADKRAGAITDIIYFDVIDS
ncbi:MAG: AMP-binding protein [Pseudomonadota bacterium]